MATDVPPLSLSPTLEEGALTKRRVKMYGPAKSGTQIAKNVKEA